MLNRSAALFLSLLFITVFALAFTSSAAANQPFETGITTPDLHGNNYDFFKRTRKTGAKTTRIIIFWRGVAPQVKPVSWNPRDPNSPYYNWQAYDETISAASKANMRVIVEIYLAPNWAERCAGVGFCNPDPNDFADFTKAAALRYNGKTPGLPRVKYWLAWNEPNLHITFLPQRKNGKPVSPLLYRDLLNNFAKSVKSVSRKNQVIAGNLAPHQVGESVGPMDFMRRMLCLKRNSRPDRSCKGKARFDIWAMNPYTSGGPTHVPPGVDDVNISDLKRMGAVLRAAKRYNKVVTNKKPSFWVTEFSWDSNLPDPNGVKMSVLKKWIPEAMFIAWKAGVTNFSWLSLRDWDTSSLTNGVTIESGLYFRGASFAEDKAKPTLAAFRFPFVAYPKTRYKVYRKAYPKKVYRKHRKIYKKAYKKIRKKITGFEVWYRKHRKIYKKVRKKITGFEVWGRTPSSRGGKVKIYYRFNARSKWRSIGKVKAAKNGVFHAFLSSRYGRKNKGQLKAQFNSSTVRFFGNQTNSAAFDLKPIKDYHQPPFG